MIVFMSQTKKYKEVLARLLHGEEIARFMGVIALNTFLIGRIELFTVKFPVPKKEAGETNEKHYQRWINKFNENQKLVIVFVGAWYSQILVTLLKVYQAGILLSKPIPEEEMKKRNLANETEWQELIFPLFMNEIYVFRERLIEWLTAFERAVKKNNGSQEIMHQLAEASDRVRKKLEGLVKHRHDYVHSKRDKEYERFLRSANVIKVIMENAPGGEGLLRKSFNKQNEEMRNLAPKLAVSVKRKLLNVLHFCCVPLDQAIKSLIPGFTSISLSFD